jgi:heme-degrading monooxygenase HmoA
MSVLSTTVIPGLNAQTYDHMASHLGSVLQATPGFRSHFAYSGDAGWTVVEVWDNEVDVRAFFEANVKHALPPGVAPTVVALHNVVTA